MSTESPRRIIPTAIKQVPEAETLISDILTIFQNEIAQFAMKSRSGIAKGSSLPPEDARILQGYAKMLVELSKESREREKGASELTDEKLLEAYKILSEKQGKAISVAPEEKKKNEP